MPRKTKEQTEKEELEKKNVTVKKATATAKKTTAKKATTAAKKAPAKKATATKKASTTKKAATTTKASATKKASTTTKASATKKSTATTKASTSTKKASAAKKTSAVKESKASTAKEPTTTKKTTATKKTTTTKKSTAKKTTTKKAATTKKATTTKKTGSTKKTTKASSTKKAATKRTTKKALAKVQAVPVVEYYDLPYRYNQTVVKLLAQTPTTLFVYWDISDEDRENYKKTYGEYFFEETKPVLIVKNNTMDYSFEVEINDFANSWYLHVNDSKCDYSIELGRRPISAEAFNKMETDYIYVTTSNAIESPNDRILFNIDEQKVYYRNVKSNVTTTRQISFINSMCKIYNIYDLYNVLYENEKEDEGFADIIKGMPSSSGLSSSTSSWFK